MEHYLTGTNQVVSVHTENKCAGEHCCIHNPSNHHMKDWPTNWRQDLGIMERMCEHGIGHPDPDALAFVRKTNPKLAEALGIHGCDGCCCPPKEEDGNTGPVDTAKNWW